VTQRPLIDEKQEISVIILMMKKGREREGRGRKRGEREGGLEEEREEGGFWKKGER
jgi:hypothetical protein